MSRHVIALVLAALTLLCLFQSTSAFDLAEYIKERLHNTIEKEHISCSNYKEFCEKSNEAVKAAGKPQDEETIKMAVSFCKAILRIHVCDVDLDKESILDEE